MKKYVCYLQEEKNDCGPACIKSILKYYHGDYDYQKLKEKLYLDKSGTSAYHMVEFLNHHGFQAVGKKYDWQTWLKERKVFPLIALVKNEALQNHYVLIYQLYLKKEKTYHKLPFHASPTHLFIPAHRMTTFSYYSYEKTGNERRIYEFLPH